MAKSNSVDNIEKAKKWLENTELRYFEAEVRDGCGGTKTMYIRLCKDKEHMVCVWLHPTENNPRCSMEFYPVEPLTLMYAKEIQKSFWDEKVRYVANMCF